MIRLKVDRICYNSRIKCSVSDSTHSWKKATNVGYIRHSFPEESNLTNSLIVYSGVLAYNDDYVAMKDSEGWYLVYTRHMYKKRRGNRLYTPYIAFSSERCIPEAYKVSRAEDYWGIKQGEKLIELMEHYMYAEGFSGDLNLSILMYGDPLEIPDNVPALCNMNETSPWRNPVPEEIIDVIGTSEEETNQDDGLFTISPHRLDGCKVEVTETHIADNCIYTSISDIRNQYNIPFEISSIGMVEGETGRVVGVLNIENTEIAILYVNNSYYLAKTEYLRVIEERERVMFTDNSSTVLVPSLFNIRPTCDLYSPEAGDIGTIICKINNVCLVHFDNGQYNVLGIYGLDTIEENQQTIQTNRLSEQDPIVNEPTLNTNENQITSIWFHHKTLLGGTKQ